MARTKQGLRKQKRLVPMGQPRKYEIDWRRNKGMELYPNMKGGMKKIGQILKFGKRVWISTKSDDKRVMKDLSLKYADEFPRESDDEGMMNEEDSSTPIADEVPTESDDVGLMKERNSSAPIWSKLDDEGMMNEEDSSTPIVDEVPTESDDVELIKERISSAPIWSKLDDKWQSVEEIMILQKQYEEELNKYIFDMTPK
jgi:hypothetical protein